MHVAASPCACACRLVSLQSSTAGSIRLRVAWTYFMLFFFMVRGYANKHTLCCYVTCVSYSFSLPGICEVHSKL